MPWKGEKKPYRIWLSEIILQQTRVEQGLDYYNKFITTFPEIQDLAKANEKDVFKCWEGLGYYSRCRNLIETAKFIHQERQNIFPSTYEEILKLKGIGSYTAAAIASFAFNLPYAVVDGNVSRVLARVFGLYDAIDTSAGKKFFLDLASELLDKQNPGKYNQAIMDFGATVCKPKSPSCMECVFKKHCYAFNNNKIFELPVKQKKIIKKKRYFHFFLLTYKNKIAIRKRNNKDIWQQLYELPLIEVTLPTCIENVLHQAHEKGWIENDKLHELKCFQGTQQLTHQTIEAQFLKICLQKEPKGLLTYQWVDQKTLHQYAFPKIINTYFDETGLKAQQ